VAALAYLLTFSTYGTHLPGSEKGWVDVRHRMHGSPMLPSNPKREAYWQAYLNEAPWRIEPEAGWSVLNALRSVCAHRQWIAHAFHVRTTHVHAVIGGPTAAERMLSDLKAYATRALRRAYPELPRRRYWSHHGSTRYL
jgi:hypothetical protein